MSETNAERRARLKNLVKDFPLDPGVYLMKNLKGQIIYVGKAKALRNRVRSYLTEGQIPVKTQHLVRHIDHIEYILTNTEVEAFLLEASLIKKHRPRYNIRLKDDKAYPYIKCTTTHEYPRFYLCRKVMNDGAAYFGPYTSGLAVRETIHFLNKNFRIRDCSDSFMKNRDRPCMTYQIGRCTAPCVGFVTASDYGADVDQALRFLRGEDTELFESLEGQMKQAAKDERFEAAAKLRDSIYAIQRIWERQTVVSQDKGDKDIVAYHSDERGTLIETLHVRSGRVIGNRSHFISRLDARDESEEPKEWLTSFLNQYYMDNFVPDQIILPIALGADIIKLLQAVLRERAGKTPQVVDQASGEQSKLLQMATRNANNHFQQQVEKQKSKEDGLLEIQRRFKLPKVPTRIECFDISNFQGGETVASQVVYEEGVPKKEDYRRYKIKTVMNEPNDFASMKEVIQRRLKHTEYDDPDLIVVDGGKGQLSQAVAVLKELGREDIPVCGLAKARTKGSFTQQTPDQTEERFFLPGRQNPVVFRSNSEPFRILVSLRDEAHRFAITYHRKLRDRQSLKSELDAVHGLGEKRKTELLKHFGSVEAIRNADPEELAGLKTISLSLAKKIVKELNQDSDGDVG